ncbi:MAG: 2-oxoglutarate dehydrogenase E1 subunit family protein, partial [Thermoguttaceae bacterium]
MTSSSTTPTILGLDLGLLSSEYVEQVYSVYQEDPTRVSPEWQDYFRALQNKPSMLQPVQVANLRPLRSGVSTAVAAVAPIPPAVALPSTSLVPSTASKGHGATAPTPSSPAANGATTVQSPARAPGTDGRPDAVVAPAAPAGNGAATPGVGAAERAGSIATRGGETGNGESASPLTVNGNRARESHTQDRLQEGVDMLIRNYRVRGHLIAKVDPLGIPRPMPPELEPKFWGLSQADLDRQFSTYSLAGSNTQTLRDIMDRLRNTYCGSISAQFMHVDDLEVREWLQRRMEESQNRLKLSRDEQIRILTRLTDAVIFEEFIRRKFVGAKSFSLEGAESLIPLLDLAIEKASAQGIESIVMAMA